MQRKKKKREYINRGTITQSDIIISIYTSFFYKKHFHKKHEAEIRQKLRNN